MSNNVETGAREVNIPKFLTLRDLRLMTDPETGDLSNCLGGYAWRGASISSKLFNEVMDRVKLSAADLSTIFITAKVGMKILERLDLFEEDSLIGREGLEYEAIRIVAFTKLSQIA